MLVTTAHRAAPLIVHAIHRLDYGGLENGLVNLVNHMPPDRYRHAVVCLHGHSDFRGRITRQDVQVHDIGKRPGKDLRAYLRIWRLLRRLRPDIVHTRNLGTVDVQWMALAAGVRHRVHGEHGWDASDPMGLDPHKLRLRRACRPAIQTYVAMSLDIARWLEEVVRVDPARIRQIYNGVDTSRFSPDGALPRDLPWQRAGAKAPITIGTVARLDPIKNVHALLVAFAAVTADAVTRPLRLAIVGDGPLRRDLEREAARLGILDAVWFAGARDDVPELMRAFDIFVLPSTNEGISNTILEAMASGLPVVAARAGGNPELLGSGDCGILYTDGATGLRAALGRYARDTALRAAHGAAARMRAVGSFGLPAMVAGYLGLYDDVMGGRH